MTILSVELHMETRQDLRPDPEFYPVIALFYYYKWLSLESTKPEMVTSVIIVDSEEIPGSNQKSRLLNIPNIVT